MTTEEKRKHSRIDSLNLLNYYYYDENGEVAHQGMGRTLNVSESGILLETHIPLRAPNLISLTIGLQEDVVEIKGRVVYLNKNTTGGYESGIEFFEMDETARSVLRQYITAFYAGLVD